MLGIDPGALVAIALAVALSALVQGLVGLGLGLISAPVITLLEPSLMPVVPLVLAAVLPLLTLVAEHDDIDWRGLGWSLPTRIVGTGVGVVLVAALSTAQLGIAVGVMVLVAVALTVQSVRVPITPATLATAGFVGGVAGTATSIGGPPMALLYQHQPPVRIRTTLAVYFVAGAALSLAGFAIAGTLPWQSVLIALVLTPALLVGVVLARVLSGRVPDRVVRPAVLAVCAASAIVLLVRSVG